MCVFVYTYFRSTYTAEKQVPIEVTAAALSLCLCLCVSSADLNAFSLSHHSKAAQAEKERVWVRERGDTPVHPPKGFWKALATPLAAIEKKLPLKAELKTLKWQPQAHTNEQICICCVRKTISVCVTNPLQQPAFPLPHLLFSYANVECAIDGDGVEAALHWRRFLPEREKQTKKEIHK